MATRRVGLLIVCAVLLLAVMTGAQVVLTARATVLSDTFLARHLSSLGAELAAPATHERVVRTVVQSMLTAADAALPADVGDRVMQAITRALPPAWIQTEAQALGHAAQAVLLGRAQVLDYTMDLSQRKAMVMTELSAMTGARIREIQGAMGSFPDALPAEAIVGPDLAATTLRLGRLALPLSLLFLYMGPVALVILCQLVGGVRHGLWVAGTAMVAAALAVFVSLSLGYGVVHSGILVPAIAGLPPAAAWVAPGITRIVADIRSAAAAIAGSFAAVGACLGAAGLFVAVRARGVPM